MAAADDDGAITQAGIVTLFDGGIKGVAIDVSDRQPIEFLMADQAMLAATRTTPGAVTGKGVGAAAAAGLAHGHSQAAPRTPLESPWRGGRMRVARRSENTKGRISPGRLS